MKSNQTTMLAGDIGGTKTSLAIFRVDSGPRHPIDKTTYPSSDYDSLEAILAEYLRDKDVTITHATFGVAGPIVGERARITNLSWVLDSHSLSKALGGAPVYLLNDLVSIGYGIMTLQADDLETINPGNSDPHGTIAVIAPGTGLGEAFLTWNGKRYLPHPSEGGHADFAPANAEELALLQYLQPRLGHVSFERVCSGSGLPNLYNFLRDSGRYPEPDWLHQSLAQAKDPTPLIVQAGQEKKADIGIATLELFVSILGSEAGNLTLKLLATGGVYLGGGIPPRILPWLKKDIFMRTFTDKGRFAKLLANVPVHVILHPEIGLFGAASHGLALIE